MPFENHYAHWTIPGKPRLDHLRTLGSNRPCLERPYAICNHLHP